jgi:hypothetical protein
MQTVAHHLFASPVGDVLAGSRHRRVVVSVADLWVHGWLLSLTDDPHSAGSGCQWERKKAHVRGNGIDMSGIGATRVVWSLLGGTGKPAPAMGPSRQ